MGVGETPIEARELTQEELRGIIDETIREGREEAKFILSLKLSSRFDCGYVYNWREDIEIIYGEAEVIELGINRDECYREEELAVIPKSVPVVVIEKHKDDIPQDSYMIIHVFTGKGWKSVKTRWVY